MSQSAATHLEASNLAFPKMPEKQGIAFVAISALILSFGVYIPIVPILVFYAIWFSQVFYKKTFILRPSLSLLPIGLFAFISVFSFFWSEAPGKTLYVGLQFASMMVCTVIASRVISTETFIKGIILGLSAILVVTILSGKYETVYVTGRPALVGFSGHKNIVGALSVICFFFSFFFFFYSKTILQKLVLSAFPIFLSFLCLYLSASGTSIIALLATMPVMVFAYIMCRFPEGIRPLVIVITLLLGGASVLIMQGIQFDPIAFALEAMNKNPTLTGRTNLWENAVEHASERPLLGHGFFAFWNPSNADALRYMELFSAGSIYFNFHNLYLEVWVGTGLIGLSLAVFFFGAGLIKGGVLIIRDGMAMPLVFMFGIMVLFFVRSMAEVELLGPFGVRVFIFYLLFQQLLEYKSPQAS